MPLMPLMPLIISRTCSSVLPTIGSPLHKVGPVKKVAVSKKQQGIREGDGMGEICGKVRDSKQGPPQPHESVWCYTVPAQGILHTFYPDRLPFSCNFESRLQA